MWHGKFDFRAIFWAIFQAEKKSIELPPRVAIQKTRAGFRAIFRATFGAGFRADF